ncbi:hypothetical protein [Limosilactobacillus reuteri]|uniref:hypothetical protein n=1 Tax=Limosilactobacillus reuteri TaxID=1598 RepID=UPI002B060526|nr:hypothetical protein [Limosilactobacillus reuteri]
MNTQTLLNNVATINKDNGIFVNAKEFLKELRQVATAVAKPSDHRPNLTFVHVRVTENNLILEATDSHVLERANVAASIPDELVGKEFLIDGKFAKNLSKTPTKYGKTLGVYPQFNDGKYKGIISIVGGGEEFIDNSRGNISVFGYPDLVRVTPYISDATCKFEVKKKEIYPILSEMKKTLSDLRKDSRIVTDVINLKVTKDGRVVISYYGKGNDVTFEPKVDDAQILRTKEIYRHKPEYEVNFNLKFLMKQLRNCGNREQLTFRLNGLLRPFTITRENGGLSLICPIRTF